MSYKDAESCKTKRLTPHKEATDEQDTDHTGHDCFPEAAAGTAQFLTPVVLGLQALAVNGKQAHWNVRGSNFIAIHELLDQVVSHAQDSADLAAERIVALGLPIDARVATVAEKTAPTAVPAGFAPWTEEIVAIVADIDAVSADVRPRSTNSTSSTSRARMWRSPSRRSSTRTAGSSRLTSPSNTSDRNDRAHRVRSFRHSW